jgi:hypothetical protein
MKLERGRERGRKRERGERGRKREREREIKETYNVVSKLSTSSLFISAATRRSLFGDQLLTSRRFAIESETQKDVTFNKLEIIVEHVNN